MAEDEAQRPAGDPAVADAASDSPAADGGPAADSPAADGGPAADSPAADDGPISLDPLDAIPDGELPIEQLV
ncbi:MAG: hypothetical protein EA387_12555, partial [Nitriliruptor sp.]